MTSIVDRNMLLSYWDGSLIRFDASVCAVLTIPDDAKQFLQTIGVPSQFYDGLNWNIRVKSITQFEIFRQKDKEYFVFGEGEGEMKICIQTPTGEVVAAHELQPEPLLINSNIQSFVIFEYLFSRFIDLASGILSESSYLSAINSLKDQLRQQNSFAISDPEYWWSTFLEEIEFFPG